MLTALSSLHVNEVRPVNHNVCINSIGLQLADGCRMLGLSVSCTADGASNLPVVAKKGHVPEAETLMRQVRPWRAAGALL